MGIAEIVRFIIFDLHDPKGFRDLLCITLFRARRSFIFVNTQAVGILRRSRTAATGNGLHGHGWAFRRGAVGHQRQN